MSSKLLNKKTPTVAEIAEKNHCSLLAVRQQLAKGIKTEMEHTKDPKIAKEIALDHLGERLDYYEKLHKMEKLPVSEENITGEVRGLGNVSGDPAGVLSYVDQYKGTNALAYDDQNGSIMKWMKNRHSDLHDEKMKDGAFDPTKENQRINQLKEADQFPDRDRVLAAFRKKETGSYEGKYDSDLAKKTHGKMSASGAYQFINKTWRGETKNLGYGTEYKRAVDAPKEVQDEVMYRKLKRDYDKYGDLDKAVNVHYTGNPEGRLSGKALAANRGQGSSKYLSDFHKNLTDYDQYKTSQVASTPKAPEPTVTSTATQTQPQTQVAKAPEQPKPTQVASMPGDDASSFVRKQLKVAEGISAGPERNVTGYDIGNLGGGRTASVKEEKPCWKNYQMVGMKIKGRRKVPNCVPVDETGPVMSRYTERPMYESKLKEFWMPYFASHHKHTAYLSKDKAQKPDTILDPGGKLGRVYKGKKLEEKNNIDEVAMAMPPNVEAPVPAIRRAAPSQQQRMQGSTYRAGQSFSQQGTRVSPSNVRMGSNYGTMKPTSTQVTRNISGNYRAGFSQQATGSIKPTSVGGSTSFSQGGTNIGSKMAASKQTSPVVKGMTTAGREAAATISKAAPTVAKGLGAAARFTGGPAATAAAAVMSPTPAGAGEDEKKRQDTLTKFNPYKSQGRSISQYEKDVLTPKASEPKPVERPKVDAPTPPERPQYFSRGQAFGAARGEAGGGEGKFSYDSKTYQTNVKGEPYKPESQLKQTSIKEETMDTKEKIYEAIDNILENNLVEMKENLLDVIQEKAIQKLEERKKEIAANYFSE